MNVASKFKADDNYGPGSVVAFGGEKEVTGASAQSTSICGVVTSQADLVLNNGLTGPNVITVAVIGRVLCEVCGPVSKGDVLVIGPSGGPQSANILFNDLTDPQAPGTIIGRAMEDCGTGWHTIDIFINVA